jgi:hypothetical protein
VKKCTVGKEKLLSKILPVGVYRRSSKNLKAKRKTKMNYLCVVVSLLFAVSTFGYSVEKEPRLETAEDAKQLLYQYLDDNYSSKEDGRYCDNNSCCSISNTEDCNISKLPKGKTTLVFPGGETRCIFSYSSAFAFQVSMMHFLFSLCYLP